MAGWLKKLFSPSKGKGKTPTGELAPLSDSDFEFLLEQLLQGVARGWQPDRLEVFMADLGVRGKVSAWEAWLERFSAKTLSQPKSTQQQAGSKLLYLSNILKNSPQLERLAQSFQDTGQQLVSGLNKNDIQIWEYDGQDLLAEEKTEPTQETETAANATAAADSPSLAESPLEASAPPVIDHSAATDTNESLANEPLVVNPPEAVDRIEVPEVVDSPSRVSETASPQPSTPEPPVMAQTSESSSKPKPIISDQVKQLFNQGLERADAQDYTGAIAAWDEAIALNDGLVNLWHNRGIALACLKQFPDSLRSLDRAMALSPESIVVLRDRCNVLMALEQWPAALEGWNQIIALRDNLADVWFQRGVTLERLNKPSNAIINYQRALKLDSAFTAAQERLQVLETASDPGASANPVDPWT